MYSKLSKCLLLLIAITFVANAYARPLPRHCRAEYFPEPEETWSDIIYGGQEPRSLLASTVLGLKIGTVVVLPIVAATTLLYSRNLRTAAKITGLASFAGAPLFVDFFYGLGRVLHHFGLYDGLDGDKRPYQIACDRP